MNKKLFLIIFLFVITSISFSQNKEIPNFSEKPRSEVPVEYTWKIEDLYSSVNDWNADKQKVFVMLSNITRKSKDWTKNASNFYDMCKSIEDMDILLAKLGSYAGFQNDMDMSDPLYIKLQSEVREIYVDRGTKLAFFSSDLLKMDEKIVWSYFEAEPKLEPFRHDIKNTLRAKAHILPQDQEKLISLTGLFTSTPSEASGYLRNLDIPSPEVTLSDGSKVKLNSANFQFYRGSKEAEDRTLVMKTFFGNYKKFENTFAALLNGQMKQHVFTTKARNYGSCLQTRVFGENIDTNVYYSLIKYVKENLDPLHRFIRIKKELLGLDKFRYEDVYASAVKKIDKVYTYEEAKDIILNAMKPLGDNYVGVLKKAFDNRWIDVYPNKGKQSGAYSGGVYGVHPFIKMNYNGKYNEVSTLAHELGHTVHSYLSNENQTYTNSGYSLFLAEIASTFNENLLMDYMLKNETDDMFKLFILDGYLDQVRGTIYRQTLFAEFELEAHKLVESGATLTPEFLNKLYLDLTRKYYGHDKGVMEVDEYIQNEWSYIPHFYYFYYVYQYSTGMLASMMLSDNVLTKGDEYREKYLTMLKSGGNDFPLEILKRAGVDMTKSEPYKAGFARFDKYLDEMEIIIKRLKDSGKL